MAVTHATPTVTADERTTLAPFAQQLLELAQRADPLATYLLAPPIDPGIWIMHLYVRGDLVDDPDLTEALAERATDILIEHDLGIATLFHDRGAAHEAEPPVGQG